MSVTVDRFEAEASFRSDSLSIDFPISLPASGVTTTPADELSFGLNNASFLIDLFVKLKGKTSLTALFSDIQTDSTKIEYGASLNAT